MRHGLESLESQPEIRFGRSPSACSAAQQAASAARQAGGKFGHTNLMTGCGVGYMQWLGGTHT